MYNIKHTIGLSKKRTRNQEISISEIERTDATEKKSERTNYFRLQIQRISFIPAI